MDISEITVRVMELINQMDNTVKFHITMQWAAIAFAATILSISFVSVTNGRVRTGINKGVEETKKYYDEKFKEQAEKVKELEGKAIEEYGENANGHYIRFANGIQICYSKIQLSYHDSEKLTNHWAIPAMFEIVDSVQATLYNDDDELNVYCKEQSTSIQVIAKNSYHKRFSPDDTIVVNMFVIGRWKT